MSASAMTPYYQRPDCTLYVADAVDLCHTYAGQTQLVVTSPPYNIGRDYQDGQGDRLPLQEYLEMIDWVKDVWFVLACSLHRADWHPCPFPEELPRRLMRLFTEPNDLVLDPFLGSGTTAVVARELGRRCAGGDLSEVYVRGSIERLEIGLRASAQMRRGQLPLELLA